MFAAWGIGMLALRQGDLRRALSLLERAMGICQDVDLSFWFPSVAMALGAAYTLAGRIADAMPLLTQALEHTIAADMVSYQTSCRIYLGQAHMLAGRLEDTHALVDSALKVARECQERARQTYALLLLGENAAHRDPPESVLAEAYYQQALALAEELGMRPLVARCLHGLGRLYGQTGRRAPARTALSAAIALYHAMDMAFWLPQAAGALAQVEAGRTPEGTVAKR